MPAERLRRAGAALVTLVAVAVIAWGVLAGGGGSDADRVDSLAGRLRCPTCPNESIADAPSETGRALRDLIAEQIAAGRSDAEIEDFFVGRYGEWVLLDPAPRGRNVWLFGLPAAAALVGAVAIWSRRRQRSTSGSPQTQGEESIVGAEPAARSAAEVAPDDPRRVRLEEQIEVARADIAAIDVQVAAGEIDEATRDRLAEGYRVDIAAAEAAILALRPEAAGRSRRRAVVGSLAFAVGAAVVVAGVVLALEPRPEGGFATGGIVTGAGDGPRDLAAVTNEEMEAVVAANPEVTGMRMALARRYLDDGELSRALDHLLVVLEQQPTAEALAYVGWITYLGGETDLGVRYLERSIDTDPDRPEALWFLALARLETGADPADAVVLLERLLENPDLAGEEREMVAQTLEQARAAAS